MKSRHASKRSAKPTELPGHYSLISDKQSKRDKCQDNPILKQRELLSVPYSVCVSMTLMQSTWVSLASVAELAELTERGDNWANNTVGHYNSEDAHHPGVGRPKVELSGLVL